MIDELTQIEINDIEKRIERCERSRDMHGDLLYVQLTGREARTLLQMAIDGVSQRVAELESELADAEADVDHHQNKVDDRDREIASLEREVRDLKVKIAETEARA